VFGKVLIPFLAALAIVTPGFGSAAPYSAPRILYLADWSGQWEMYAADPAGGRPPARITFGRGVTRPVPSPDGRLVAFLETGTPCTLYVAKFDGTRRRRVDEGACSWPYDLSWSRDSKRLLYVFGRAIYVSSADGMGKLRVANGSSPAWSPTGRSIAFLGAGGRYPSVYVRTKTKTTQVFSEAQEFAWSPTGDWIAVARPNTTGYRSEVDLVRPDGRATRKLSTSWASELAWSQDGRFLAFHGGGGLVIVDVKTGSSRSISFEGFGHAWSPKGHMLAFDGKEGLAVVDPTSGATRSLTTDHSWSPTWSLDGRSVAYVVRLHLPDYDNGDLKVATLGGASRTLVAATGTAGGTMDLVAWLRPQGAFHYEAPTPRRAATVTSDELVAPWGIERLATDEGRIAYVACGHVFVWTPATGSLLQAEPAASLSPRCREPNDNTTFEPFQIYDLAVAGERLAFGTRTGNNVQTFSLYEGNLTPTALHVAAHAGGYAGCGVTDGGIGELSGSGDLLVFSRWKEVDLQPGCLVKTTSQEIDRLDPGGCPCPSLGSSPGPFVPADVDDGRIVAVGDNKTLLLDESGARVLSIPVSATAAQLDGSDLVVVRPGILLRYNAGSGALLNSWPLPNVGSSGPCGSPHPWACLSPLILEDARNGFATYTLEGQVHVVRLADGRDSTIGPGTTARFFTGGLAYANGSRIRIVPFANLPR
jgi:Tol biopolymer transport system component